MKNGWWLIFSIMCLLIAYGSLAQIFWANWLGLAVFSGVFIIGAFMIPIVMSKAMKERF